MRDWPKLVLLMSLFSWWRRAAAVVALAFVAPAASSLENAPDRIQNDDNDSTVTPPWLQTRLGDFQLRPAYFPDTGRGLQTTVDRKPGEVLLTVPQPEAVTASGLLKEKFGGQHDKNVLARAMDCSQAEFDKPLSEEQIMALGLLLLRNEKDRYVESLPRQQYSVLTMPHEILTAFPVAYQKLIQAYQDYVETVYQESRHCLKADPNADDPEVLALLESSPDDFYWAFASVRSRCLAVSDEDVVQQSTLQHPDGSLRVMLPGFDLFNHKFGAQIEPNVQDGQYVFSSDDAYQAGDQVFISYSSKRDNLNMLMTYGFCPADNPDGRVFWDNDNLLAACAAARPHYFSTPVLQQLDQLLTKLGKTKELYVYDAVTHQAQTNLERGLAMMAEIEQQFLGDDSDPTFVNDVLQAMVYHRQVELERGLKHVASIDVDAEWQPMLQSVEVLLSTEQRRLAAPKDTNTQQEPVANEL